jgi:hypothetical protein
MISLTVRYVTHSCRDMAFGWSAGDIASALNLLLTVGKALKEACEASSEYENTHSFLTTLQTTLQHLQAFDPAFARSSRMVESPPSIAGYSIS